MWFNQSDSVQLLPLTSAVVLSFMRANVIFFVLMAGLGKVPQLEADQACEEREAALNCELKDWERKLVKAYLINQKLKSLTPVERLSIPDFEKVISFR